MRHCKMYYAGYKYLNCDKKNHCHRLQNLQTGEVELWENSHGDPIGIPFKNTFLRFKDFT